MHYDQFGGALSNGVLGFYVGERSEALLGGCTILKLGVSTHPEPLGDTVCTQSATRLTTAGTAPTIHQHPLTIAGWVKSIHA